MNKRQRKKLNKKNKRVERPLFTDPLTFLRAMDPVSAPYSREIVESLNQDRYRKEYAGIPFFSVPSDNYQRQLIQVEATALHMEREATLLQVGGKIDRCMDEIIVREGYEEEVNRRIREAFGIPVDFNGRGPLSNLSEIESRVRDHLESETLKILEYKPMGRFTSYPPPQPLPIRPISPIINRGMV